MKSGAILSVVEVGPFVGKVGAIVGTGGKVGATINLIVAVAAARVAVGGTGVAVGAMGVADGMAVSVAMDVVEAVAVAIATATTVGVAVFDPGKLMPRTLFPLAAINTTPISATQITPTRNMPHPMSAICKVLRFPSPPTAVAAGAVAGIDTPAPGAGGTADWAGPPGAGGTEG